MCGSQDQETIGTIGNIKRHILIAASVIDAQRISIFQKQRSPRKVHGRKTLARSSDFFICRSMESKCGPVGLSLTFNIGQWKRFMLAWLENIIWFKRYSRGTIRVYGCIQCLWR